MTVNNFFNQNNWNIVSKQIIPSKDGEYFDIDDLNLSDISYNYLKRNFNKGIYKHQKKAIEKFKMDRNIAICTSTASGKSLVFQISAMEELQKNPKSTIIAVYPVKALGNEQEERWINTFKKAGLDINIGRIDGNVEKSERERIIKTCQLVIVTPDIIHSWFLGTAFREKFILKFIQNLSLIIIDEAHTYSGVFGSHSAYLFRRLMHIKSELGGKIKYIAASATIKKPECHLKKLLGQSFDIIGQDLESSPKEEIEITMVNTPNDKDFHPSISEFLNFLANQDNERFIAFVDSRQKTENITTITNREAEGNKTEDNSFYHKISPYRSGYEVEDRNIIQKGLTEGKLKGVISTSALEMGLDISGLTTVVLFGVPYSATSFWQRIGRVGRNKAGKVIIINDNSANTRRIFKHPEKLLNLALSESTLYLGNPVINYIHALCLARDGGEHDIVTKAIGNYKEEFYSQSKAINTNQTFMEFCKNERYGQLSSEFQILKASSGEIPNLDFPLREIERQYKVVFQKGLQKEDLGSLSKSQLMREAYPGAVYRYCTRAFRVFQINESSREVLVKEEKQYFTDPLLLPLKVYPNLIAGQIHSNQKFGNTLIIESEMQIQEKICGYKETKGNTKEEHRYPNQYYKKDFYKRYNFTTGVLIHHPEFNNLESSEIELLAQLFYESFLMTIPFERQDINFGSDRYLPDNNNFMKKGDRFICIYDQCYKSLHLTERITRKEIFDGILQKALEMIADENYINKDEISEIKMAKLSTVISYLVDDLKKEALKIELNENNNNYIKVIKEGSIGVDIVNKQDVLIKRVFYNKKQDKLMYQFEVLGLPSSTINYLPIEQILEVPGQSEIGFYDDETGLVA
ncbi:MAG: DEAD/DEAH box helicase [Candidatus Sericytochromatia bacterium]